jgi:acylphosphatase
VKRVKAIVDGIVQGVGYRYNVKHIAIRYKLKGYVKNLDDGRVEIVAEGDEQSLERFLSDITIKREPILVESIDVSYEEPTGEFRAFKIVTGSLEDEMVEGFSTGAMYFNIVMEKQDRMLEKQDQMLEKQDRMLEKQDQMLEKQDRMLEKQDQMLEKQDRMLEKQDQMLEKQDRMLEKQDQMLEKQDRMLEKQDQMLEKQEQTLAKLDDLKVSIVEEIHALREDIKAVLDKRLSKIEEDIMKIKIRLGMV